MSFEKHQPLRLFHPKLCSAEDALQLGVGLEEEKDRERGKENENENEKVNRMKGNERNGKERSGTEGREGKGRGVKRLARDDKATAHVDLLTALCVCGGGGGI